MSDATSTHNEVGDVGGSVVQAATIHQVVLPQQPARRIPPRARQIPAVIGDFTGRVGEIAELDTLLDHLEHERPAPTAVVTGMAGVGKTTLAVSWAHRVERHFPDGILFADLSGHGPGSPLAPGRVLASFLQALGTPADQIPTDPDSQAALYRSSVAGRRVLVVLDNAATADQVRPLLPAAAGCLAVVTSRSALTGLAITGSTHRVALGLLTFAESTALIRSIIGATRADAETDAVNTLVVVCARLPLALRITSTHIAVRPHSSVADTIADIRENSDPLDALSAHDDERSAVRTVFDWSYARLSPAHARTFRRLGLHPGVEVGVHVAAVLTDTNVVTAYRHLEALAERHLVEPVGRKRYRMHDLLHAYAAHRAALDETEPERGTVVSDVLAWYAHTAITADRMLFPANPSLVVDPGETTAPLPLTDRDHALTWLTSELTTLQTALRQAAERRLHQATMGIASSMRFLFFRPRSYWPTRVWAESLAVTAAHACGDQTLEAGFLLRRANTRQQLDHWEKSDVDHYQAIELARWLADHGLLGDSLTGLGRTRVLQQRFADAERYFREALPLVKGRRNGYVEAVVHSNLSIVHARWGRFDEALQHAELALEFRRTAGSPAGIAYGLHHLAVARQGSDEHDIAIELCRRAVALHRAEAGEQQHLASVLETMSRSLEHKGDLAGAESCLAEAIAILTDLDQPRAQDLRRRLRTVKPPA
ncbi:ATP-binding protein [Saccharothrix sp. Mg75]|uniref:ATP-binding protein n=1 Tax=Saccharothrix sp. Mg75 TaxID=3445357 RepID=UPI003EEA988E